MFYARRNTRVFMLSPTLAIGLDQGGQFFLELGWLLWAVGVGSVANA